MISLARAKDVAANPKGRHIKVLRMAIARFERHGWLKAADALRKEVANLPKKTTA